MTNTSKTKQVSFGFLYSQSKKGATVLNQYGETLAPEQLRRGRGIASVQLTLHKHLLFGDVVRFTHYQIKE